jgi:hypothetical protein
MNPQDPVETVMEILETKGPMDFAALNDEFLKAVGTSDLALSGIVKGLLEIRQLVLVDGKYMRPPRAAN